MKPFIFGILSFIGDYKSKTWLGRVFYKARLGRGFHTPPIRAILQGDVCKKTESGNCQRSRMFSGILSLEKAFEPGFWSEITITDLLKAKMAAH